MSITATWPRTGEVRRGRFWTQCAEKRAQDRAHLNISLLNTGLVSLVADSSINQK